MYIKNKLVPNRILVPNVKKILIDILKSILVNVSVILVTKKTNSVKNAKNATSIKVNAFHYVLKIPFLIKILLFVMKNRIFNKVILILYS